MKIKGKRYDFKTYDDLAEARKVFEDAGDIIYSNSNPITGEYWIQVILIGGKVKKELEVGEVNLTKGGKDVG